MAATEKASVTVILTDSWRLGHVRTGPSASPPPTNPPTLPNNPNPALNHSIAYSRYDSWGRPFFCFVWCSLHLTTPRQVLVQPIFDVHGRRRGHVAFRRKATPQEYDAAPDRLRPLARAAGDVRCGRELLADAARDRTATLERCDRPEPFPTGS